MNHLRHAGSDGTAYTRRDPMSARAVYKAHVVRRLLGAGAARAFMKGMRLDAALIERVLRGPEGKLRR
jgi:hypothetical protein